MRFSFNAPLLSPLLKLFGMPANDTPNGIEFRAEELGVTPYLEFLALTYNTLADAKRLLIISISIYKQRILSQHEHLIVTVQDTSDGAYYHFCIERMGDMHPPEPVSVPTSTPATISTPPADSSPSHQETPSPILPPTSSSSDVQSHPSQPRPACPPIAATPRITSLDSLLKDEVAKDTVLWVRNPKKLPTDCLLGTLTFPPAQPFFLYHVIVLAVALHKATTCYRLFSYNCYHFAGVLTSIFEELVKSKMVQEPEVDIPKYLRQGSWFSVSRTFNLHDAVVRDTINNLKAEYETEIISFEQALMAKERKTKEDEEKTRALEEAVRIAKDNAKALQEENTRLKAELAKFANVRLDGQ